jgi:hypothetical protein
LPKGATQVDRMKRKLQTKVGVPVLGIAPARAQAR